SGGFDKNTGWNIGNDEQRTSIGLQNGFKIGRNLEVNSAFWYSRQQARRNGSGYITTAAIYEGLVDRDGNPRAIISGYRRSYAEAAQENGLLDWEHRTLDEINLQNHTNNNQSLRFTGSANLMIVEGLNLRGSYQYAIGEG